MLAGSERKSTNWIVGGIGAICVGRGMSAPEEAALLPGLIIMLLGIALCIRGCTFYARGKGQDPLFGLFGVFGLLGVLVLMFLEDKYKCCKTGGENCTHGRDKKRDWSSKAA